MTRTMLGAAVLFSTVMLGGVAIGRGGGVPPLESVGRAHVCREDVRRFCHDVEPGEGRIYACLKAHEAELMPGCREHLAKSKGRR
jgi:hypothetical protein